MSQRINSHDTELITPDYPTSTPDELINIIIIMPGMKSKYYAKHA